MTNRKWINNSNVYDLLLQMNNCIRYKSDSDFCIMDCLAQYDRKNYEHFERVKELENRVKKVNRVPLFLRIILSEKQYKYYTAQRYEQLTILQISVKYNVSTSTVCRTISLAKRKILKYYENQMKG